MIQLLGVWRFGVISMTRLAGTQNFQAARKSPRRLEVACLQYSGMVLEGQKRSQSLLMPFPRSRLV